MKIADLTLPALKSRLADPGIFLRHGPFIVHIRTRIPSVADSFAFLYTDFQIAESDQFADYHVSVERPRSIRRWLRPTAVFRFDGARPFNPHPLRQALPFLEGGMNWSVFGHAHQYLIIHAAVVERGGRALLLPGRSGSGKSTLCAALVCRGWRLLTDELALISPADGCVVPLPRPVGLKNDSIDVIRRFAPEAALSRAWVEPQNRLVAYMRPPSEALARIDDTAIPAWIIFVEFASGKPARLEPIPRCGGFLRAADNAVNYNLLGAQGFETLAKVIDRSSCYALSYGNLEEAVAMLGNLEPACRVAGA